MSRNKKKRERDTHKMRRQKKKKRKLEKIKNKIDVRVPAAEANTSRRRSGQTTDKTLYHHSPTFRVG